MPNPSPEDLYALLDQAKTIAIVGASSNIERPSFGIMQALQGWGYRCLPVNPNEREVLGEQCYANLGDIPQPVDIVNVFRRPASTPEIADQAVAIGAKVLWLQLGIANDEAAARAQKGGLIYIENSCIAIVHRQLRVPQKG
jgi:predicted CoA-binding protein